MKVNVTVVTVKQVREIAIEAAGLAQLPKPPDKVHPVAHLMSFLGAVQLDTISTLARSHELVFYSRLGALDKTNDIEAHLWTRPATTFEYWSHAACILPLELYPWFAFRRRAFVERGYRWEELPPKKTLTAIKKQLADGPATATDLGGARKSGYWWDRSDIKVGLEWLLDIGVVVCTSRNNWRREYQLTDQALIQSNFTTSNPSNWVTKNGIYGPDNSQCLRQLLILSMQTLGIATFPDLIDVHRLTDVGFKRMEIKNAVQELIDEGTLLRIQVRSWNEPTYTNSFWLAQLDKRKSLSNRAVMLSPFDQLIWHRERLKRIFGMDYKIEAYTPAAQRKYGYFNMPVLFNNQLIARVDPHKVKSRKGTTFVARVVTFEGNATQKNVVAVAKAIEESARWIGATDIEVGAVSPAALRPDLIRTLQRLPKKV